jgi:hypothetical protein
MEIKIRIRIKIRRIHDGALALDAGGGAFD